jgi:hypothetical protein
MGEPACPSSGTTAKLSIQAIFSSTKPGENREFQIKIVAARILRVCRCDGVEDLRVTPLVNRSEFRAVLKELIKSLRRNLDPPGVVPLSPEQIMFWLQNVTLEDLQVAAAEIDRDQHGSKR